MRISRTSGLAGLLLSVRVTTAIELDVNSKDSLVNASRTIVQNILGLYSSPDNENNNVPGLFGRPYYWWESGLAFDSLINYWSKSGDDSIVETVQNAMLFQIGPNNDYMPPNQTKTLGNDDQASWALAAMTAAEVGFPERDGQNVPWAKLAQNVFDDQVMRWDDQSCGGGLKWQIFSFNAGYNYKNFQTQASFALLASRLARYTGNSTYSEWAQRAVEWSYQIGLVSPQGSVYDGTDDTTNCSSINHIQWTINAGLLMDTANTRLNTSLTPQQLDFWNTALYPVLSRSSQIFTADQNASADSSQDSAVLYEVACAPSNNCNVDQLAFRTRLARALGNIHYLFSAETAFGNNLTYNGTSVSAYDQRVNTILQSSAQAAAAQCTGGKNGTACGNDWVSGKYDGTTGLGQELSALEILLANIKPKGMPTAADGGNYYFGPNGTVTSSGGGNSASASASPNTSTNPEQQTNGAPGLLVSSTMALIMAVAFGVLSYSV